MLYFRKTVLRCKFKQLYLGEYAISSSNGQINPVCKLVLHEFGNRTTPVLNGMQMWFCRKYMSMEPNVSFWIFKSQWSVLAFFELCSNFVTTLIGIYLKRQKALLKQRICCEKITEWWLTQNTWNRMVIQLHVFLAAVFYDALNTLVQVFLNTNNN